MKPLLVLTSAIALLVGCSIFPPNANNGPVKDGASGWLTPFSNSDKVSATNLATGALSRSMDAGARSVSESNVYFHDTSNQTLYVANPWKGLVALDLANPRAPSLQGTLALKGTPYEMVDAGTQVAVMSNPGNNSDTSLVTFVSKPGNSAMATTSSSELGGWIVDSRVVSGVGSGSVLFVATNDVVESATDTPTSTGGAPSASTGTVAVDSGGFYGPSSFQATIWAVDVQTGQRLSKFGIPGSCSAVCISEGAVYVASIGTGGSSGSTITRYVILSDGSLAANPKKVSISGYIQDRFKLDEDAGVLRLVEMVWTSDWNNRSTKAFSIEYNGSTPVSHESTALSLGSGESLFASRFDGSECYIVTFLQVDPLFCVSFADPANPIKVGQELAVPGYSTHLEVVETTAGKKMLFAIGVDSSAGWKVKASLYDISNPTQMARVGSDVFLGDAMGNSWSSANWDWKRVNRLGDQGPFALPYASWDPQSQQCSFNVSIVDYSTGTLHQRCLLPDSGDVERTIPSTVTDVVYTYAADRLQTWQLASTPNRLSETAIAEDVAWVGEVGRVGVKLVNREGRVVVQTFALDRWSTLEHASELVLPSILSTGEAVWYRLGNGGVKLEGSTLYLVGSAYRGTATQNQALAVVVRVDLSGTPSLVGDPITLVDSTSWGWGGPSNAGTRFIDTTEPKGSAKVVYLFHGGVSRIPSSGAVVTTSSGGGFTALGSDTAVDLFTWDAVADHPGYARVTRWQWDFASGKALLGQKDEFPGYPVLRTRSGEYLSCWSSFDATVTTHLMSIVEKSDGFHIGDTVEHDGELQACYSDPSFAVLVVGGSGYYPLMARASVVGGSGTLEVRTAWVGTDGKLSDTLFGNLKGNGWAVNLVRSGSRWAVGGSTEVIAGSVANHASTIEQSYNLTGGAYWTVPTLSLTGRHLYVARGMTGIERYDVP